MKTGKSLWRRAGGRAATGLVTTAVAAALLVGCGGGGDSGGDSGAAGVTHLTVAQPFVSTMNSALYIAQEKGYFADEKLDVEFETIPNGNGLSSLLGGSTQIALETSVFPVSASAQGQQFDVFAATGNGFPESIIVNADEYAASGLSDASTVQEKVEALAGKPLGVLTSTGENAMVFKYLFKLAGVSESQFKPVTLGTPTAIINAVREGQVFAAAIGAPYPQLAEADGYGIKLLNLSAGDVPELTNTLTLCLSTTPKYREEHPEVIERFIAAVQKGQDYLHDHPAEAAAFIASTYFPDSPQDAVVEGMVDQIDGGAIAASASIDKDAVTRLIDFMTATDQEVGSDWQSLFGVDTTP